MRALFLCLLLAVARAAAGDTLSVGSFTKSTGTAPVTQNVAHGLGETPKAVIIWSAGKTSSTLGANARLAFGVSDTSTSRAVSCESDDAQDTSAASRRISDAVVTMVDQAGTLRAEADVQSVTSTNIVLNWTTNNTSAYVFHFIAIGGRHVQAKVVGWTMRTSSGNQAVTGVGFTPDVVLFAHAGTGHTAAPPSTSSNAGFGLSVMDGNGNQWGNAGFSTNGAGTSDTSRYQRTNQALVGVGGSQSKVVEASFVSMDSDGFTINYTTGASSAGQIFALALKGVQAQAGSFTKTTGGAPASQSVTGVAFRPRVVLLTSAQDTARTAPVSHNRFGLGASDDGTEGSIAMQDTDALGTTSVDGVDKTDKVFVQVDNNTPSTDAQADLTSLDAAGFSLSWTTNDAVATEMLYLALSVKRRVIIIN